MTLLLVRNCATGRLKYYTQILNFKPNAVCYLKGNSMYPALKGVVFFYKTDIGTLIAADVCGLPEGNCGIFAFHIHEGSRCTGNTSDEFLSAGSHYNPTDSDHPCHAGDMPPLFSDSNGYAFLVFSDTRITVDEIIDHTVIIHSNYDTFSAQPSGNAGEKIACGVIRPY